MPKFFLRWLTILIALMPVAAYAAFAVSTLSPNKPRGATSDENFQITVDDLSADTVTETQLRDLGLDLSAFNDPLLEYELAYLKSILSTNAASKDEWQSDIGNKSTQDAAQWKLGRVSDGTDNESEITFAMIDAAIGGSYSSSEVASARSATLSDIQTFWTTASINTTSVISLKTFMATSALIGSVEFASYLAADSYLAHSDKSNYSVANFNACYNHSDSITGGANTCSISYSNWSVVDTLFTSVNDNSSTNVTKANLDTLFGIDNSSYSLDLTYSPNLQYTQDCIITLTSESSSSIKSCVTSATQKAAAKWKVYQISRGHDNTTHPLTDLDVQLYDRATSDNGSAFLQNLFDARPSYAISNMRSQIRSYFPANSITDTSSDTAFKQFPVVKVGFKNQMTSYTNWLANTGFSVSTVDNSSEDIVRVWEACRRSLDTTSGGSGTCTPTYATWAARAADRASNNIVQVSHNDGEGIRTYYETLMGITYNIKNIATAHSTEFEYLDANNTSRTRRIQWISSAGHYSFWYNVNATTSPPTGAQIEKQ